MKLRLKFRDRETERQRDREAERQKDRKTEIIIFMLQKTVTFYFRNSVLK